MRKKPVNFFEKELTTTTTTTTTTNQLVFHAFWGRGGKVAE